MSEEPIHDEVLGCVVKDVVRGLWIAHVPVLPDQSIEVRLIGGLAKALPTAKKLISSLGENESRARLYAAEQLLDLHNEVFSEEELLTEGDFGDRLHLDSAASFDRGCMLCFKDRRNEWEHGVNVLIGSDGGFLRADTAPTLFRPENRIHVKPFPPLTLAMGFWTGKVRLNSWSGFLSRLGSYGSVSLVAPPAGTVRLSVRAPGKDRKGLPSEEQTQAFFYLLDNEAAIQKAVVDNILAAYPRIRDRYCPEGRSSQLPTAVDSAELKRLIGPSNIHILKAANRGFAYVGFEFRCTWDGEHGLGVVTHEDRVVTLGSADTSFDENVSTLDIK